MQEFLPGIGSDSQHQYDQLLNLADVIRLAEDDGQIPFDFVVECLHILSQ